ncbi:MAG: hypothetical protein JWP91_3129 [Fibrobacteres bacterium]|nr:hypothetical protein [Fibrobacterota bacterium]
MHIDVNPCNGGLGAQLLIHGFTPEESRSKYGNVESMQQVLAQAGIAPEFIDKPSLQLAHNLLGKPEDGQFAETLEEIHSIIVASGVAPTDDEVLGLRIAKSYLMEEDELTRVKCRLGNEPFDVTEKSVDAATLVEVGDLILSFTGIKKGVPGIGVFGAAIPTGPENSPLPRPGNAILEEEFRWVALKRGILVVEDNTFKILGPRTADRDCIRVSHDRMSVRILLRKEDDDDFKPTMKYLEKMILERNFAFAPDMNKVASAFDAFAATGKNQEGLILSGKASTPGKNGRLELLINPEPLLPEPDKAGRVDFKSFSFFRTVKKGTPLSKVIAPIPGTVGIDVFGQAIPPKPVAAYSHALGGNTELQLSDPAFVIAARDGRLVLSNGVPEVVQVLQINEDVSLKTGNIAFPGSVEIFGDVRDNLEIKAKGDVEISGVVENGSIVSEGAIVVKGGFTGSGKGVIKSKLSSVSIGFIRNQRIESHSDIIVYNEVVNAQLCAMKSITMKTLGNSVVGGHLLAYTGIEIYNAGSRTGVKTILEVGKDFEVELELNRKKAAFKEVETDLAFLEIMAAKLQGLIRWGTDVKGDIRLLEQRSRGVTQILKPMRESLAAEVRALEARLYNPGDCFIWVKGEAFPGTILRFQDRNLILKASAQGKRWRFKGNSGAVHAADRSFADFA